MVLFSPFHELAQQLILGIPPRTRCNGRILIYPPLDHWIWLVPAVMLGACIGSFLNVVIYRVPRGMSVNTPNRSFCPSCKHPIPMTQNIPVLSWLWLRGKCSKCKQPIALRYVAVEILTALLFALVWREFPPQSAGFLWGLMALLVAITFIDAEHLIIHPSLTWSGTALGLLAAATWPRLPNLAGDSATWMDGLKYSATGWLTGFFGLWSVVELGKLAFGRKRMIFPESEAWSLHEPENDDSPLELILGDEHIPWWDIFSRKSDRVHMECTSLLVDGIETMPGKLELREQEACLPDGRTLAIAELRSLNGTAREVVISREAMGFGDVHLLGMIGAFFGWGSVLFSLFAASVFALVAALIGRVGFGKPLPFGPFLALGALAWMFGGWRIWAWYLDFLQPLFAALPLSA